MKTEELEKTLSNILKSSGNFSITTTRTYQYDSKTDTWVEDRKDSINSQQKNPLHEYLSYIRPKPKSGLTIKQIYKHYIRYCNQTNTEPASLKEFSSLLKTRFKPRDTKLHGNTVYDVDLLPFQLETSNEFVENAQEELDRYEQERNLLETELYKYMDLYAEAQEQIKDLSAKVKYLYERGRGSEFRQLCKSVHQYTGKYHGHTKSIFEY